ncbi:hypothetical protein NM688_g7262 [Phlebia brevispora]|uniref:Uncharacterized protein n=1 Tax=Phlebia brevispora TaxID=194682 RepID=A0ACC1S7C5_9APHY|nr:hypothetical protein NM688_g7262 [Phlebia brevispora]
MADAEKSTSTGPGDEVDQIDAPASAARRCLSISELLEQISEALCGTRTRPELRDVTSLALTCKAYHEPAQNIFWRDQQDLLPLVKCFPVDSWEIITGNFEFKRALLLEDWARFMVNAARVKSFHHDGLGTTPGIDHSVLSMLATYRPSLVLFPNLRKFRWENFGYHFDSSPLVTVFFSPSLTSITLYRNDFSNALMDSSILRILKQNCPNLTDLSLGGDTWSEDIMGLGPAVAELILSLSHLRTLYSSPALTGAAVVHLATLPSLQSITFTARLDRVSATGLRAEHRLFPSVKTLEIHLDELDRWSEVLLTSNTSSSLKSLKVTADSDPQRDILLVHVQGWAQYANTLRSLDLAFPESRESPPQMPEWQRLEYTINGPVIAALYPLRKLEHLSIYCYHLDLTDEDLWDLSEAFPNLNALRLHSNYSCGRVPRVTAQGVVHLTTRCPSLECLGIALNATNLQWSLPAGTPPHMHITKLLISDSPIDNPAAVALFLSALIAGPTASIELIKTIVDDEHKEQHDRYENTWREVNSAFKMMQLAREQERARDSCGITFPTTI